MTLGVDPNDRMSAAGPPPANGWQRHIGVLVRVGVVLVVLGAAGASSWHYVRERFLSSAAPAGPVPVIGPGDEPIKEAPKQPGGMQVPDQDKIILNGAAAQPKVEQILPPPPPPLPSPTPPTTAAPAPAPPVAAAPPNQSPPAPSPPSTGAPANPPAAASAPSAPPTPPRTVEAPAPQVVTAAPLPATRPTAKASTPPPVTSAPAPTIAHESAPPELAARGWFVQLGAVRSTAAAQTEWTRLKHAHADLLASLKANAVRVERGGAVLYRIEAGPLADGGAASHLCRSLLQRHVACIVLRP